jgi:hypothetical protein
MPIICHPCSSQQIHYHHCADPTTTAYLPSTIHLAARATADVDVPTTAHQCLNHLPTVVYTILPAITTHLVTLAQFTAEIVTPKTTPSIVCPSTTDRTSSPATDVNPDAYTVSVNWRI